MKKYKCVVCGRDCGVRIKMPAGGVSLCHDRQCRDEFNLRVNEAVPIAWFSIDDMEGRGTSLSEVIEKFKPDLEVQRKLGQKLSDMLWNDDTFCVMFSEALSDLNELMEMHFVSLLPDNELPLYINTPFTKKAKEALLKRYKGE